MGKIIKITMTYEATHKQSVCINVVFVVDVVVVFLDSAARSGVIQVLNVTEVIDCFIYAPYPSTRWGGVAVVGMFGLKCSSRTKLESLSFTRPCSIAILVSFSTLGTKHPQYPAPD